MDQDKRATDRNDAKDRDNNPDLITGAPGSHPVGTGLGSAGGAAAGAAIGSLGGPIGTIVGGILGAVTGGGIGHGVGEYVDPTEEYHYWQQNYAGRDYYESGKPFEDYEPAYAYGYHAYGSNKGRPYKEVEPSLRDDWEKNRGKSTLSWDQARAAVRDSYDRVNSRAAGKRSS
jgi:hypothetical protein